LPIVTALLYGELAPLRGFIAGAGIAVSGVCCCAWPRSAIATT
jgi:hypothetical protein